MALTWLTKTRQYFTTKVFTEDRFRTNDRPTESEYSNLFQSIVFKVHDLATSLLAGIVRKATKLDFLTGKEEKPTTLTGYTHNDPLYVSPALLGEFIVPAGTILSWIPFRQRNHITGQRFADNSGNIEDTGFQTLGSYTNLASVTGHWFDTHVIEYFEKYYLSPRYRICDGRLITFISPYTNLQESIQLPDLRERVLRQGSNNTNPLEPNQQVFQSGGDDFINLSHTHLIRDVDIEGNVTINPVDITLSVSNLPSHTHTYNDEIFTSQTISVASGTGTSFIIFPSVVDTPAFTSATGSNTPFTHTHALSANDFYTQIETPADLTLTNFSHIDNRQKYFNTYFIMAIY
ncbi:MAG: hypothetical protein RML94_00075 [Bacteroidia bacterium]|nr:hypothetical protein [Bacteroidia bacterium]